MNKLFHCYRIALIILLVGAFLCRQQLPLKTCRQLQTVSLWTYTEKSQKGGEPILELICKGLIKWLSTLFLEAVAYFIN